MTSTNISDFIKEVELKLKDYEINRNKSIVLSEEDKLNALSELNKNPNYYNEHSIELLEERAISKRLLADKYYRKAHRELNKLKKLNEN
jgi:hypothetical protein